MTDTAIQDVRPHVASQPPAGRWVEVLLIVLVFFTAAGEPPPHNNEAHYLSRLKHAWNPGWCAGDLFLESADAQVVFNWTFGWVTRWLSLPATAWVGRLVVWALLAWAWQRLSWRVVSVPLASVLSAALFVTLMSQAHLAGEWVVGGVEAKGFAYGFVLLALCDLVDGRWNRLFVLLGAASAFHPLVGGWSVVVCCGVWVAEKGDRSIFAFARSGADRLSRKNGPVPFFGLAVGGFLALLGIIPALRLTWGTSPDVVAEATWIYVFDRLPHHLALLHMPVEEIVPRILRHGVLLGALWWLCKKGDILLFRFKRSTDTPPEPQKSRMSPVLRRVALFAGGAALLAAVGFAIELLFWNQPLVASRLLRYYWFRLTDFAAPMAVALYATALIAAGLEWRRGWAVWGLAAALLFTGWHLTDASVRRLLDPTPPADRRMRDFDAWVDVCEWVAEHTPPDALFLTPRLGQSFKWRTGRPEVATRKDIPQDAASIVEWHGRLQNIYYHEVDGEVQPIRSLGHLDTERVLELAGEYGFDFVITDQRAPLGLPVAYWNEEYVVYSVRRQVD